MSDLKTMKVRPLSYEEITAIAELAIPGAEPLEAYAVKPHPVHGDVLVATTYHPVPRRRNHKDAPHQTVYAPKVSTRRGDEGKLVPDLDRPVGFRVVFNTQNIFGVSSGATVYTTEEAEKSVGALGDYGPRDPAEARLRIAVPDDDGIEVPLMPIYGAQVTTSILVKGADADEVLARVEKALAAEFGDTVKVQKNRSRPVTDIRVNVYDLGDDKPIAVNVLESEAAVYAHGNHRVEPVTPGVVIGS